MVRLSTATLLSFASFGLTNAYWLMGVENFIVSERLDPLVSPNLISGHTHSVLGGSNFGFSTNTEKLRQSECSSIPIIEDKSNYWFPHLYFEWANGSVTSLTGGAVIYYLFDTTGNVTAFPDDFRMLSGDPTLRSYDPTSFAQQAVTFLCLDFDGVSTKFNELPPIHCPSGIRAQINFPHCWDGKNLDSPDHKSHVTWPSDGADSGTCKDPKFPVTLPRIFMEVYWDSNAGVDYSMAKNTTQPFVYAYGDTTGYGYHADFINGWDAGVLQKAVNPDGCTCNPYGDFTCCVDKGIFKKKPDGEQCHITSSVDETVTGTLPKLPGNNPIVGYGPKAPILAATSTPNIIQPVYAYTGASPTKTGTVVPASAATGLKGGSGSGSSVSSGQSSVGGGSVTTSAVNGGASAATSVGGSQPSSTPTAAGGATTSATANTFLGASGGASTNVYSLPNTAAGSTDPKPTGGAGANSNAAHGSSHVVGGGAAPNTKGSTRTTSTAVTHATPDSSNQQNHDGTHTGAASSAGGSSNGGGSGNNRTTCASRKNRRRPGTALHKKHNRRFAHSRSDATSF